MTFQAAIKLYRLNVLKLRIKRMEGMQKATTVQKTVSGLLVVRAGGDGADALGDALAQTQPEKTTLQ